MKNVLYSPVMRRPETHKALNPSQYGFHGGVSCIMQLVVFKRFSMRHTLLLLVFGYISAKHLMSSDMNCAFLNSERTSQMVI